jgi:hypothetical protein
MKQILSRESSTSTASSQRLHFAIARESESNHPPATGPVCIFRMWRRHLCKGHILIVDRATTFPCSSMYQRRGTVPPP